MNRLEPGLCADDWQDRPHPGHPGEAVEELVLGAENDGRPQDHCRREGGQHGSLAFALRAGVIDVRSRIRPDRGDLHQLRHALGGGNAGDPRGAVHLHCVEVVLPALAERADTVHHRIRTMDHSADRGIVADVARHRLDLARHAIRPDEKRLVRAADRDAHAPPFLRETPGDVATDKARTADDGDKLAHARTPSRAPRKAPETCRINSSAAPLGQGQSAAKKFAPGSLTLPNGTVKSPPVPRWRNW